MSGAGAGRRPRRCWRRRPRTSPGSRPAWVGPPLVGLAELRRRQGRAADADAPARPGRRVHEGAAVPGPARARARRGAAGRRPAGADPAAAARGARSSTARPRSSCSSTRAPRAASSRRRRRRSRRCARSRWRPARRRCAPAPTWPRACSPPPAASTSGRARCSRTRSTRFERCGAPYEAAQARIELATSLLALGRGGDAEREAAAARERLAALGATRRGRPRAAASSAPRAPRRRGAHPARARRAAPARRRADQPADRRAARRERAHRAPPRHEPPAQARAALADGGGGVRRALRLLERPRIARTGHPPRAARWPVRAKPRGGAARGA